MKSAAWLLSAAFLAAAPAVLSAAPAAQSAAMSDARVIVETLMPPEQRAEMVRTVMQQMSGQIQQAIPLGGGMDDPGLRKILEDAQARMMKACLPTVDAYMPRLADAMAIAYTQEFGPAELKDIRAFAQTPAGRHYLSRSTAIIGNPAVAQANQAYFRELAPIMEAERKTMTAELKAYFDAHPDLAEKVAAAHGGE